MLVLTRSREEGIVIGDAIEVKVLDIRGDRVRLGVIAPDDVTIHRKEVYLAIQEENREAARDSGQDLDRALESLRDSGIRKVDPPAPVDPPASGRNGDSS